MNKYWLMPSGTYSTLCMDVLRQNHTLIAGTTGSGKSVLLNSIIYTALYKSPSTALFILIDTKGTELKLYKKLPHTIKYETEPENVGVILDAVIAKIKSRTTRAAKKGLKQSDEPHIYIVIDELSDLIYTDRHIVPLLARIAMTGRAANVHIIAGTQCPNRRTLPAEIISNCDARIGLRCRDKIESRQIIGTSDAADLPRYGYGYYLSPDELQPRLWKIPLTPENELADRVKWWTDQKKGWWRF